MNRILTVIIFFALVSTACSNRLINENKFQNLFNGKNLEGWNTYIGPSNYAQDRFSGTPLGVNYDPNKVFSVANVNGEKVIRISGENYGALSTQKEFENYHLTLDFKWGKLVHPSKMGRKKDSGVLYHSVGPYGADSGFWMRSQEFQVQEGDCGDYWGCAGGMADIKSIKNIQGDYVFDAIGDLNSFGEKTKIGRHCIKNPDMEKPTGEWNTIEIYCHGDTSVHVLNGVVNMILYRNRQYDNGREIPLIKGKIQLQSEGSEVFYKNIRIRGIINIPNSVLQGK